MAALEDLTITVDEACSVSALLQMPQHATACYVMAHGAGAGMTHPFMTAVADGLAARGIATLRYQFPFMQQGSKRPDRPTLAHRTVRAAVAMAASRAPSLPLVAGGKSFGGRMTSQAQAETPLPRVQGLVFFGFPLHPAGQPSTTRADHLGGVSLPMLFLQGTRDALADMTLLRPLTESLGERATIYGIEGADHAFKVPAKFGTSAAKVLSGMLDAAATWTAALAVSVKG